MLTYDFPVHAQERSNYNVKEVDISLVSAKLRPTAISAVISANFDFIR